MTLDPSHMYVNRSEFLNSKAEILKIYSHEIAPIEYNDPPSPLVGHIPLESIEQVVTG